MKTYIKTLTSFGIATLLMCWGGCKKEPQTTVPKVKIYDNAISVSYTSANVTGEVTNEGSSSVTERGFIYGKQGESRQDTMYCGNGAGEHEDSHWHRRRCRHRRTAGGCYRRGLRTSTLQCYD